MVIDTSALLALLLGEPEAERVAHALEAARETVIAAPTLVEAMIVAQARLGPDGVLDLEQVLREAAISVEPFDSNAARAAVDAWRRFGKGRHPAALNLGDCYAYGLAATRGDSLLFVGDDFSLSPT